jgi:transcriptional regulator with XRE-family HTH domain
VSDFAENLRNAMFNKRCKAVDISRATKITPSVISRYLSGTHQPSTINLIAISKYLGVSPEALLSSSEAPESSESSRYISSDKDKIIAVQEELIKNLQKQVGNLEKTVKKWEDWKASSKDRHAKGREKAKADLAISKHKNTLRINTTRKRKK